jgi:hypothetical protein
MKPMTKYISQIRSASVLDNQMSFQIYMKPTIQHQNITNNQNATYQQINQHINILFCNQQNSYCFFKTSNLFAEICSPNLVDSSKIFMKIYSKQNQQLIKTLSIETFIQQLPNCNISRHKNCRWKSKSNLYSCSTINIDQCKYRGNNVQSGYHVGHPDNKNNQILTTMNIQTIHNDDIINTEYCIALIRYSYLYHVVHVWNMNTTELIESHILQELSPHDILRFVHCFVQRSTNEKYVIVIIQAYSARQLPSKFSNSSSSIYQYKLDSNGKRANKYKIITKNKTVVQFEGDGQIGMLIYKNGSVDILNLLNLNILMKLSIAQINISSIFNPPIVYCSHSLFHMLPVDRFQFDCVPLVEFVFPTAIIVVGEKQNLQIFHILGTQIQSINQYKYEETIKIKLMEIQVD